MKTCGWAVADGPVAIDAMAPATVNITIRYALRNRCLMINGTLSALLESASFNTTD
jgi:hypothetical protein